MTKPLVDLVRAEFQVITASPHHSHRWFELLEALQRWQGAGADEEALLNVVFALIAQGFHDGALSYAKADGLANDLHLAMQQEGLYPVFAKGMMADALWWRIYLAFDAGEYRREPGVDPVSAYTEPQVADLVAEVRALGGLASIIQARSDVALRPLEPAATFSADAARTLPRPPPPRHGPYRGRRARGRG